MRCLNGLLLVALATAQWSCPSGWSLFPSTRQCVRGFNARRTWGGAVSACKAVGGNLVTITNAAENNFVWGKRLAESWIGLNDQNQERKWVWQDGSTSSYRNWMPGEPNDVGNEDCAVLGGWGHRKEWGDIGCHAHRAYICGRPAEPASCPPGWSRYAATKNCVRGFSAKMSWNAAQKACRAIGANLVTITSQGENNFVHSKRLAESWIGLTDQTSEKRWLWIGGSGSTYRNWMPGEPNDVNNEDCAVIGGWGHRREWGDINCNSHRAFICGMHNAKLRFAASYLADANQHRTKAKSLSFTSKAAQYHRNMADALALKAAGYSAAYLFSIHSSKVNYRTASQKFLRHSNELTGWTQGNGTSGIVNVETDWEDTTLAALDSAVTDAELDLEAVKPELPGVQDLSKKFDCNSYNAAANQAATKRNQVKDTWGKLSLLRLEDYYRWSYQHCMTGNIEYYANSQKAVSLSNSWYRMKLLLGSPKSSDCTKSDYWGVLINRYMAYGLYWRYMGRFSSQKYPHASKWADGWIGSAKGLVVTERNTCKVIPSNVESRLVEVDQDSVEDSSVSGDSSDTVSRRLLHLRRLSNDIDAVTQLSLASMEDPDDLSMMTTPQEASKICRWIPGSGRNLCYQLIALAKALASSPNLRQLRDAIKNANPCNIANGKAKELCDKVSNALSAVGKKTVALITKIIERVKLIVKAIQAAMAAMLTGLANTLAAMANPLSQLNTNMGTQNTSKYCKSIFNDLMRSMGISDCCAQAMFSAIELGNDVGWIGFGYPPSVTGAMDATQCIAYAQMMCAINDRNWC